MNSNQTLTCFTVMNNTGRELVVKGVKRNSTDSNFLIIEKLEPNKFTNIYLAPQDELTLYNNSGCIQLQLMSGGWIFPNYFGTLYCRISESIDSDSILEYTVYVNDSTNATSYTDPTLERIDVNSVPTL